MIYKIDLDAAEDMTLPPLPELSSFTTLNIPADAVALPDRSFDGVNIGDRYRINGQNSTIILFFRLGNEVHYVRSYTWGKETSYGRSSVQYLKSSCTKLT